MTSAINFAFMRLARRAEGSNPSMLAETFVDAGPLFTLLQSADHQILYGRRGTGKTHALKYLAQQVSARGDLVVYVDMRTIGSNISIYSDASLSVSERASRLLVDTLTAIQDNLVDDTLSLAESSEFDYGRALKLLDELASEITTVSVVGDVEVELTEEGNRTEESSRSATLGVSSEGPQANIGRSDRRAVGDSREERSLRRGVEQLHINLGAIHDILGRFVRVAPIERVWVLLDEWSQVPLDLQPILADMLRRTIFPVGGCTVKIGAIEQMARFRVGGSGGSYVGLEVGADITADVDLDEFMVFGNDPDRAKMFFRQLLFRHVRAALIAEGRESDAPRSIDQFIRAGFTQANAFAELVRAAEGVPRDAINVANLAAQQADEDTISVPLVRGAARTWYVRDKEQAVASNPPARDLLHAVQDDVIGARRARAFFLSQTDSDDPRIADLYNARVLHVIKRNVASYAEPGVRFDVYAIDYGAYVHLQTTDRATLGLFETDDADDDSEGASYVEVPQDDYRSIRRAILRLSDYPTP